jgi:uncharacterized protein (TIGR02118 family)
MMKSIALLTRRADVSRADFQRYYETRHAPLAIGYFPFEKYVRNHLQDHEDAGFDTISEFWAEDLGALTALMDGPVGEILREDERRFMDQSKIRPAGAEEILCAGPPRGVDDPPRRRVALLLEREPGLDDAGFRSALKAWGEAAAPGCERLAIDLVSPWTAAGFPAEAIAWIWPAGADQPSPPEAGGVRIARRLLVQTAETPPTALLPHQARQTA